MSREAMASISLWFVAEEHGIILTNKHVIQPGPLVVEATFLNPEENPVYPLYVTPFMNLIFPFRSSNASVYEMQRNPCCTRSCSCWIRDLGGGEWKWRVAFSNSWNLEPIRYRGRSLWEWWIQCVQLHMLSLHSLISFCVIGGYHQFRFLWNTPHLAKEDYGRSRRVYKEFEGVGQLWRRATSIPLEISRDFPSCYGKNFGLCFWVLLSWNTNVCGSSNLQIDNCLLQSNSNIF